MWTENHMLYNEFLITKNVEMLFWIKLNEQLVLKDPWLLQFYINERILWWLDILPVNSVSGDKPQRATLKSKTITLLELKTHCSLFGFWIQYEIKCISYVDRKCW